MKMRWQSCASPRCALRGPNPFAHPTLLHHLERWHALIDIHPTSLFMRDPFDFQSK